MVARYLLTLCATPAVLSQMHAGTATIYTPAPYSIIVPTSTKTFSPGNYIPAGTEPSSAASDVILSPDGGTFYAAAEAPGMAGKGLITAVDRATGKSIRTYRTVNFIWDGAPITVTPGQSQIYVGTCYYSLTTGYGCGEGYVEVLDVSTGQSLAVISVGGQVFGISAAPDGSTAYAVHFPVSQSSSVNAGIPPSALTAIDTATLQPGASFVLPGGWDPQALAITPDGQFAYVVSDFFFVSAVYRIDLAQMTLAATIPLPPTYTPSLTGSLALSRNGATLAVCGSQVYFIETATGSLSGPVPGVSGGGPAMSPDGTTAYLTGEQGIVNVVDVATLTVTPKQTGDYLSGCLISPDGEELYLLLYAGTAVAAIPEESLAPSMLLRAGNLSSWLAISPDGGTLYSATQTGLEALSTSTGQVTANMLPGTNLGAVAVSPDGFTIYAIDSTNSLAILNASTGALETSIPLPVGIGGYGLAVTPKGDRVYAMSSGPAVAIDATTQRIVAIVSGTGGSALAMSPSGSAVYISNSGSLDSQHPAPLINVVSTATNKVTGTIPVVAYSIVISPDGTRAYVYSQTDSGTFGIAVIDTSTFATIAFIPLPGYPYTSGFALAVTPDGAQLFIGGSDTYIGGPEPTRGTIIDTQSLNVSGRFPSYSGALVIN
jgi:DNA-binding beta-propeller fold protein YncE